MSTLTLSLQRLGDLLVLFDRERRALSTAEIVARLAAPRSSVAALLKALVEMGWLAHDRRAASYLPTAKFATLAHWVVNDAVLSPALIESLQVLQAETGETISLSAPNDLGLEVLHVVGPDIGIRLVIRVGARLELWGTAIGTAYLATLPDPTIRSMYQRSVIADPQRVRRLALPAVIRHVRRARDSAGIAYFDSAVVPDVGAMSVALPKGAAPRTMVVSIGGPVSRMRAQRASVEITLRTWLNQFSARTSRASRSGVLRA